MATVEQLQAARREDDFRPARFLMLIRRHLWLIIGIATAVVVVVVAYTVLATQIWQATASIRIDHSKTAAAQGDFTLETEINTEMAVLGSRSLAEEAVDSLSLRGAISAPRRTVRSHVLSALNISPAADTATLVLTQQPDSGFLVTRDDTKDTVGKAVIGKPATLKGGVSLTLAPGALEAPIYELDIADRTYTLDGFQKALNIDRPSRLGNLVTVAYKGSDALLAREIVDLVVRRFIISRQAQGQGTAQASVSFLKLQLDSLSRQLRYAEDSLRTFRDQRHVVDIGVEATSGVNHLADLQAMRNDLSSERDALGQMLAEIRAATVVAVPGAPSPYRRLLAFPTLLKNQAASQLLNSLAGLEDQRAQLLIRRTPADPDVQTVNQRITDLDDQLRAMAETYHSGLANQIAALDITIAKMTSQLAEVPGKELEAARLERRPKVLGELYELLQTRLKEAELAAAAEEQDILLVDPASVPYKPVSPRKMLNLAAGLFLGGLLGLLAAFAREFFDHSVHTRYDVQALTGVPVLGLIPRFPQARRRVKSASEHAKKNLVVGVNGDAGRDLATGGDARDPRKMLVAGRRRLSGIAEAFGHLQTNLAFVGADGGPRVIMITSPLPGDGKTTSATNLALILSQRGQRVVLIDADLRRGVINRAFSTSRSPGLTEALTGKEPLEKAIWTVKTGEGHKLYFIPTGELPTHPAGLLGSEAMKNLLDTLLHRYDVVLLDSAPVNSVTDSAVLARHTDGVLVVARSGTTPLEALSFGIEQLRHVKAPILGAILNDIDLKRDSAYDRVYQYYGAPEYTGAKS
jgi:tyrosine-protein kinase Etk/Wzc